jgi:aspartyl aminopeptidase
MHSAVETAGSSDLSEMIKGLTEFYSTSLVRTENGFDF